MTEENIRSDDAHSVPIVMRDVEDVTTENKIGKESPSSIEGPVSITAQKGVLMDSNIGSKLSANVQRVVTGNKGNVNPSSVTQESMLEMETATRIPATENTDDSSSVRRKWKKLKNAVSFSRKMMMSSSWDMYDESLGTTIRIPSKTDTNSSKPFSPVQKTPHPVVTETQDDSSDQQQADFPAKKDSTEIPKGPTEHQHGGAADSQATVSAVDRSISAGRESATVSGEGEPPKPALAFPPSESTAARARSGFVPRGRKGMDAIGILVSKDNYCWMSDMYLACLKLNTPRFLLSLLLAPLLVGVLFTPLFLFDLRGLAIEDEALPDISHVEQNTYFTYFKYYSAVLFHVFLYSLSLSTTFGGSPVSAQSPFSLVIGNLNTLLAQFMFVFLSGAVFARMSQPTHTVRCSNRAIIRQTDFVSTLKKPRKSVDDENFKEPNNQAENPEKIQNESTSNSSGSSESAASQSTRRPPPRPPTFSPSSSSSSLASETAVSEPKRVLAMRFVLTGPPPSELVDVKIHLTMRLFLKTPSGGIFVSVLELPVARPEVAYMRFGSTVRHVIDESSPLYGHTQESLVQGDASISLCIMGMERSTMESVFHAQEYFAYDNEIIWGGDFEDTVKVDADGNRTLDHSKLNNVKYPPNYAYPRGSSLRSQSFKEQVCDLPLYEKGGWNLERLFKYWQCRFRELGTALRLRKDGYSYGDDLGAYTLSKKVD